MKKYCAVTLLIVVVFGCHLEQDIEPEKSETNEIEIVGASNEHKALFGEWSTLNEANARVTRMFDANNLVEIRNSNLTRWAVVSNVDPNTSLTRGLWVPTVGLVCAGVATGRNSQNK